MTENSYSKSLTIAIISDLHTIEKGKCKRILDEAFEEIQKNKVDFVLSAGDNVNGCQQGEFNILTASINNHLKDIPFYTALGNHDYFPNNPDDVPNENARSDFFDKLFSQNNTANRFQNGTYSLYLNGIHIIFLDCIQNRKNFKFDDEQAAWLESELEKSKDDRFRIVVNHLPLAEHNLGCKKKSKKFMAGNDKLQHIIDKYNNIIYISGHTHNRIDSDYSSAEQDEHGNIYLNAGSIGNTQPCVLDTKRLKPIRASLTKDSEEYKALDRYFKKASMGLFLEIHDKYISVKGYDFSYKEYIERCNFVFEI
ncbi:MAG: metallophosphoesterase family protein [Candidatus Gastranaerophilaceae bacterium]